MFLVSMRELSSYYRFFRAFSRRTSKGKNKFNNGKNTLAHGNFDDIQPDNLLNCVENYFLKNTEGDIFCWLKICVNSSRGNITASL